MKNEPFVIERVLNAPCEKVWKAITDKEQMKQWYFDLKDFRPVVGFEFEFSGGPDGRTYLHLCKILEVVEGRKLKHSWKYQGHEGESFVTWELIPEGNSKTKVVLTHEGLETFPINNPDFAKSNFEAGWTHIVGTSLKEFAEKV